MQFLSGPPSGLGAVVDVAYVQQQMQSRIDRASSAFRTDVTQAAERQMEISDAAHETARMLQARIAAQNAAKRKSQGVAAVLGIGVLGALYLLLNK